MYPKVIRASTIRTITATVAPAGNALLDERSCFLTDHILTRRFLRSGISINTPWQGGDGIRDGVQVKDFISKSSDEHVHVVSLHGSSPNYYCVPNLTTCNRIFGIYRTPRGYYCSAVPGIIVLYLVAFAAQPC